MIKITNLNFEKRTIENIEVDGEDIHDVELRMTKTKFKIVIKKKGETIKREIKKKKAVESVDFIVIKEEIPVMETPVMKTPVMEEPVMEEPITLGKLKELLKLHIPKQNTLDSYVRTIQQVYDHFKITDMQVLLTTKEKDIIRYIESKYSNDSTIKSKLCSVYKAYKILNFSGDIFKQRIDYYATNQTLKQEQTKQENKKTTEEGNEIIEHFNNQLKELETTIQKDTQENDNSMLNNWDVNVQLYCILKIYMTYGVLRPSEILNCLISDCECDDNTNYINVNTKQIVINQHKNDFVKGKKWLILPLIKSCLVFYERGLGGS
jgi:hypothetical protein